MTITLKAKEVNGIIDDQNSLLISANTTLKKAKSLIVEHLRPTRVEVVFEEDDYVNETVTLYIHCEVGKEGWITEEMMVHPKHLQI
jgi:hypothetical protein